MNIKVKITSVQEEDFWYANEVGTEFEAIEIPNDPDYLIYEGKHEGKFIHREDCEIIVVPEIIPEPINDEEEEEYDG